MNNDIVHLYNVTYIDYVIVPPSKDSFNKFSLLLKKSNLAFDNIFDMLPDKRRKFILLCCSM